MNKELEENSTLSHYRIISKIGKGGMGEVYLAQDIKLNRKVAIKFLNEEFSQDTEKLNRFVQEAQATSALNHPNILTVYEIGDTENSHFIATEFIDGKTLREHIVSSSFSIDETLKIAVQICEALNAAHQSQIIHRDIKPENIMIRDDGYVKILDFGLAKLTEKSFSNSDSKIKTENLVKTNPGMIMGTAKYMSPEQARGNEVDARSDIFSFGIVLFEMCTGQVPFEGKSEMDTIALILRGEPISWSEISPHIPIGLEGICKKTLQKNPDRRYQSSEDLLADFKKIQEKFNSQIDSEEKTIQIETSFIEHSDESIPNLETNQLLLTDFINLTGDGIFNKTLKLALGITLAQSPSIDIFPETGVRNTLRLMEHSPDDPVDDDLGREICRREGMKAYIKGTIANIGTVYMITLEAVNAKTGVTIGQRLEQADSKEKVLEALGKAATGIRESLGEGLSSIEKFDVPLIKATTPSLEALKLFTIGTQQHVAGKPLEAIPYYQKAVKIDSEFAYAYGALSIMYQMMLQPTLAAENATKAYQFRERTSELEKLRISYFYHSIVIGDIDKAIESLKLYRKTYPRDERPCINLCYSYSLIGQFEKALEAAEESVLINPSHIIGQGNLIGTLIVLDRYDEAKQIYKKMEQLRPVKEAIVRGLLFSIAFIEEDEKTIQELVDITDQEKNGHIAVNWQTETSAFRGQFNKSKKFSHRSIKLAQTYDAYEPAAQYLAEQTLRTAFLNLPNIDDEIKADLKEQIQTAFELEKNQVILSKSALTLAFTKEKAEARELIDKLKREYSKDFVVNQIWIPSIEAVIHLQNEKAEQAIEAIENVKRFEAAAEFIPQYIRGLAYIELSENEKAVEEFQKILSHRGEAPLSLLYPLAQLGKARTIQNKLEYERFFEIWKDADENILLLIEAKKEYKNFK